MLMCELSLLCFAIAWDSSRAFPITQRRRKFNQLNGRRTLMDYIDHSNRTEWLSTKTTIQPANKTSTWQPSSVTQTNESLAPLLLPCQECNPDQLSPSALAYIGDTVLELHARCRYIWPTRKMSDLQNVVVGVVRAEFQAELLAYLTSQLKLTTKEQQVLLRGRNAGGKSNRGSAYQDATALEALVGYLYLTDPHRCAVVVECLNNKLDQDDQTSIR